jgi:hypothetical protein
LGGRKDLKDVGLIARGDYLQLCRVVVTFVGLDSCLFFIALYKLVFQELLR